MIKYLKESLINELISFYVQFQSFPGVKIEGLTEKLSSFDLGYYKIVLVHVGTNNSEDLLSTIVWKFNCLFIYIYNSNPEIKVLVSGLIPRGPNQFGGKYAPEPLFLSYLNFKIEKINEELEKIVALRGFYFFRRNPNNWNGRDGLHLNF